MRKTENTHPFLVKSEIPKGNPMGLKSRTSIRNSRFKNQDEAMHEVDLLIKCGASFCLVYNKKDLIYNSKK